MWHLSRTFAFYTVSLYYGPLWILCFVPTDGCDLRAGFYIGMTVTEDVLQREAECARC